MEYGRPGQSAKLALEFQNYGPYRLLWRARLFHPVDCQDTLQLLSIAILLRDQRSVLRIIHVLRSHRPR